MKKHFLILLFYFLFLNFAQAQKLDADLWGGKDNKEYIFAPKFGIIHQSSPLFSQTFGEIGLSLSIINQPGGDFISIGPFGYNFYEASVEFNFDGNNFIYAPKLTAGLNGLGVEFRANIANYFAEEKSDFRIIPEVGFSPGPVGVYAGWNIHTFGEKIEEVSTFKLSLVFRIPVNNDFWFFM